MPFLQRPVSLPCRVYADDTSATRVASTARNARHALSVAHDGLRAALAEGGYEHNEGKSNVSPSFVGPGSKAHAEAIFGGSVSVPGSVQFDHVSLGIKTAVNGGVQGELRSRTLACRRGYSSMGKC